MVSKNNPNNSNDELQKFEDFLANTLDDIADKYSGKSVSPDDQTREISKKPDSNAQTENLSKLKKTYHPEVQSKEKKPVNPQKRAQRNASPNNISVKQKEKTLNQHGPHKTSKPQQTSVHAKDKGHSHGLSAKTDPALKTKTRQTKAIPKKEAGKVVGKTNPSRPRPDASAPKKQPKAKAAANAPARTYIFDRFYKKLSFSRQLQARYNLAFDIDADKIRYVVSKVSKDDIQVLKWGIQRFPSEEINRFKALQIAMETILTKEYKRGMSIHVSIFSPDISIRQVILPKIEKEAELRSALTIKNQNELPNFTDKTVWTYEIVEEFEDDGISKLRVLVTVVPEDLIANYVHVFKELKIRVNKLISRPAALQSAYKKMVFRPDKDLLIDISYDFTQICLMRNGFLEYIRNVGIGARNLETTIHEKNKDGNETDQDLTIPALGADKSQKVSSNLLRDRLMKKIKDLKKKQNPVLHTFFSEILRSMSFIQGRSTNYLVERIMITGYGVRKESLIPYLRSRLHLPMFILAPQFENLDKKTLDYTEYFSTIGTALHQEESCNILPKSYMTNILFAKLNWILTLIMITLICGFAYFSLLQYRETESKKKLIAQYEDNYERLNPIEGIYNKYKQEIEQLNNENRELRSYIKAGPPIIEVLRFFSNETPDNIRLESIQFVDIASDVKKYSKEEKVDKDYKYRIELNAVLMGDALMGDAFLINYINKLKSLNYFKHILLLNKNKIPENDEVLFTLDLYL
ncbi:MAG TPA: hypothetical protein ENK44_09010 [Caldithrix abyssi]|uniref:Type IV pilus assembly protein PilM n=1 Tax=Caldithrix abyssi TaxID=187145 RepID=A0A7V4U1D2_CALAY|nr:hypothetical protein [Caldithrix abyssi]